jgi:hypothetical protein
MPAENFTGRVALDTFRADVPRRDDPEWIQHEDGVLLDTLDEKTKSLLQAKQVFAPPGAIAFGQSSFSQITRNGGVADTMALTVGQIGNVLVGPKERSVFAQSPAFVFYAPRSFAWLRSILGRPRATASGAWSKSTGRPIISSLP